MFERLEYPRERSYQCASSERQTARERQREGERQTERMMGLLVPADAQEESVSICPCIQPILLKSFLLQTYTHTHTVREAVWSQLYSHSQITAADFILHFALSVVQLN